MKTLVTLVLVAVFGFAIIGGPAQSASAATVVLVSTDGVTYTPSLTVGLFNQSGLLIPGSSTTSELWIKNPTASPATVRVSIGSLASTSTALGDNITMSARNVATGTTVTRNWADLAQCVVIAGPLTIAGSSVVHLNLTLTMLNAPALMAQAQSLSFVATVAMRDDAAGAFPVSVCDPAKASAQASISSTPLGAAATASPSHQGLLSFTGGTFPMAFTLLGAALFVVGWFLVALRRRRTGDRS